MSHTHEGQCNSGKRDYPKGEFTGKKGNFLVQITKEEAHVLNSRYRVPFKENGISHTYSKNKHYYLSDYKNNLKYLQKIRDEKLIRTVE